MSAVARFRLCSRDSARTGVFARRAMSSALSAFLVVYAGYLLLLSFLSLKTLFSILSIDVLST